MTLKRSKRTRVLVILLCAAVIGYIALIPTLRRMSDRATQLNREAEQALRGGGVAPERPVNEVAVAVKNAEDNPNDIQAQMTAVMSLGAVGRFDEAEKIARHAVVLQPDAAGPKIALAETQRRARKYYESVLTYRELTASHPADPQVTVGIGSLYVSFGWTLDALDVLKKGLAANPNNIEIKIALALASLQQDNMGLAVRLLNEVRQAKPKEAQLWAPIVDVYNKAHRYKEAIATAKDILQINSGNLTVKNELGTAYLENGNFAQSISTFQETLATQKTDVVARYGLAKSYLQSGREANAKSELESLFNDHMEYADSQLLLGQIYLRTGNVEKGRELLTNYKLKQAKAEKAKHQGYLLSNRTHVADSHWQMAKAYSALGDKSHSLLEVQRTLELSPKHVEAAMELKRLLAENHDTK